MTFASCTELFSQIQIQLNSDTYEKLKQYATLLLLESEHQNVTAVRTEPEIWKRHFLDSAYLLQFLTEGGTVLDVGTGGGIPAIPLAIMNSKLQVTMLDSELRKIEFCRQTINRLELSAKTICGRAEELSREPDYENKFDFVVSRAMANGSILTELAVRFLKVGGSLIAMKGKQYDPSIERFSEAASALGCKLEREIEYTLDSETKNVIILKKISETPSQYPRRYAKIKRNPL